MASPTVLSVGSVTVTATGATGALLNTILGLQATYTKILVGPGQTFTTIPQSQSALSGVGPAPYELIVQPSFTGPISIPTGVYASVIVGATGAVTGGDSSTVIIGSDGIPLNYNGGAGTVIGTSGGGSVEDTANGATLDFTGGAYSINAFGVGDTIVLGSSTISTSAASTTGDVVTVSGANTTVTAEAGADTVFAVASTNFQGSAASSSIFVGSNTGAVTVTSAANQSIFGGSAGGTYTEGTDSTGSFFFWGNHAGSSPTVPTSDTLFGTASSPNGLIWGASEDNTVVSQAGAGAAFGAGNTFVDYGDAATIDATHSRGGDSFVVFNIGFTNDAANHGNFAGNTTLVGSNAGNELFGIFDNLGLGAEGPAHTITIENWVSTDVLGFGGYETETSNTTDLTKANAALASGSNSQFTLSDGTTIKFEGTGPTSVGFHI